MSAGSPTAPPADWWLSTAPLPHASTAAIARPRISDRLVAHGVNPAVKRVESAAPHPARRSPPRPTPAAMQLPPASPPRCCRAASLRSPASTRGGLHFDIYFMLNRVHPAIVARRRHGSPSLSARAVPTRPRFCAGAAARFPARPLTRPREARKDHMTQPQGRPRRGRRPPHARADRARDRGEARRPPRGAGGHPPPRRAPRRPASTGSSRTSLESEVPLGDIDIAFYRDDLSTRAADPEVHSTHLPFRLEDYSVVLVDDVLYTGRTARAGIDALFDYGRPDRVQLAVLADRGHRELPIRPDYVGKNLPTARNERVNVRVTEVDGVDEVAIVSLEGAIACEAPAVHRGPRPAPPSSGSSIARSPSPRSPSARSRRSPRCAAGAC